MADFTSDIESPHEHRSREFKRSQPWDELKWKLTKTAMAMANTRDGGLIIVGVEQDDEGCRAVGVVEEHLATYGDDAVQAHFNKYADPYVSCRLHKPRMEDDRVFVVLEIDEFDSQPVVCKKSGPDDLRQGATYVRSRRQPETCEVQSQTEMRELLDVAIDRGVRSFVRRAAGAGVQVHAEPTDAEQFEEERREFLDRLADSSRLKADRFLIAFRPTSYDSELIQPLPRILDLVQQHEVRWYGWTFPFTVRNETPIEQRCAGSPAKPDNWKEFWRLYQSGQFLGAVAYREDEEDPNQLVQRRARIHIPSDFTPRGVVNLHTLVTEVTLAWSFLARLAAAGTFNTPIEFTLRLDDTAERVLVSTDAKRSLNRFFRAIAPSIESKREVELDQLVAEPRVHAARMIADIFHRFDWPQATADDVQRIQASLFDSPD